MYLSISTAISGLSAILTCRAWISLCCTKIILAETWKVWFVETINLNFALDGVNNSVVHDCLDVLLLGDLEELFSIGRCREIFCRGEEEELILYILH